MRCAITDEEVPGILLAQLKANILTLNDLGYTVTMNGESFDIEDLSLRKDCGDE